MAGVDLYGNPVDDPYGPMVTPPPLGPGGTPGGTSTSDAGPGPLDVEGMIARDTGAWRGMLQQATHGLNFGDPTKAVEEELPGVLNWVRANVGKDPRAGVDEAIARLKRRGAPGDPNNIPGSTDKRTPPTGPTTPPIGYTPNAPGNQFTDPYTRYLEELSKQQIARLQGADAQFQKMMGFLDEQFARLSNNPSGWTADELAALQTQALEPILAQRDAAQRRTLERAGLRGLMPSSGVVQSEQGDTERAALALQTQANRDIALRGIDRQRQQLQDAINLVQMSVAIPDQRQMQALGIAQNLYQLPRNALNDALAVTNSANPATSLGPLLQLLQLQQGQANTQSGNQAALWALLGQIFGQVV